MCKQFIFWLQIGGRINAVYHNSRRPRITQAPLSSRRRVPTVPAYIIVGNGNRKSKTETAPIHEVNIIKQTVILNKNRNPVPTKPPNQGHTTKTSPNRHSKKIGNTITGQIAANSHRHGAQRQPPIGLSSMPNGIYIMPSLAWLRKGTVRQALKRQNTRLPNGNNLHLNNPSAQQSTQNLSTSINENNNPTNIIIYQSGQKQPLVIRTSGPVTLTKVKTTNGQSNIVISKTASNLKQTTTLKPGEDPPELENELLPTRAVR